ncbi:hypothetical protein D5R81_02970 [Parashewanella spongiae]|uniref:Uncharacterized protein n=1 Tax=Parashewanella spongiae TaxID=342950 RepID=A0A3A6TWU0_9GAMM|nr:hypothetical protein D5R81_02970 [Parashewanella spongiae]
MYANRGLVGSFSYSLMTEYSNLFDKILNISGFLGISILGAVDLSRLNFVLFEHLSVQGVSSDA